MSKESKLILLRTIEKELSAVYKEHDLLVPSQYDFQLHDTNIYALPTFIGYNKRKEEEDQNKISKKKDEEDCTECNSFCIVNDLDRTISDLKYFTGLLFLYHPFINNPIYETVPFNGKSISLYNQNLEDRRYSLYVSCCFEKWYNYWDRIGDALFCFVPDKLKIRSITFSKMIDRLGSNREFKQHPSIIWLKSFKDNDYKRLNGKRIDVVHFKQFETQFRYKQAKNSFNFEKLKPLFEEKSGMKELFKSELERCAEGWYHLVKFGEYVNQIKRES